MSLGFYSKHPWSITNHKKKNSLTLTARGMVRDGIRIIFIKALFFSFQIQRIQFSQDFFFGFFNILGYFSWKQTF